MAEQVIDLTHYQFWIALLCGILFVSPLSDPRVKSVAFSLLNCFFLALILSWTWLYVVAAIFIVYLLLHCMVGRFRTLFATLAMLTILLLFVFHKSSLFDSFQVLSPARHLFAMIGFSYIALRMIEVVRAIAESRYPPPTFIQLMNYLVPFHMLAAGPIQSYDDFVSYPVETIPLNTRSTIEAIERITLGLFKKFVIAYLIQETFLTEFESHGAYFFLEVQFFFIWLYLDFSAYSDIAVGVGKLLGIHTPENFNQPYLARNVMDFWERWHITLSKFVFANIFFPMQLFLTRRSLGVHPLWNASFAFTIAFLACGLWHGISFNFLFWGGFHAIGVIVTNLYRAFLKKRLGRQGLKSYMQNRLVLWTARVITFEYIAFSLVVLFYP